MATPQVQALIKEIQAGNPNMSLDRAKTYAESYIQSSTSLSKPTKFEYGWLFFRGDNNLLAYLDLCEAAAEFANELESENK